MKQFSTAWKRSTQVRKQRKYRYNAPLHIQQKFAHVHLASPLRAKYGTRNIQVRKGDKIKVLRGQYKKKEGKVERVDLKRGRVYVNSLEVIKKDGSKVRPWITPSNLLLVDLDLVDKKRKQKLEKSKTLADGAKHSEQNPGQGKVGISNEINNKTDNDKTDNQKNNEKVNNSPKKEAVAKFIKR